MRLSRHSFAWLLWLLLGACSSGQAPQQEAIRRTGIVSVFSRDDRASVQQSPCTEGRCGHVTLEDFSCPRGAAAEVLIVSGHSSPPTYLNGDPERVARIARCYRPGLIVLDTCYGFSLPLLEALADEVPSALVVGATHKLPVNGLLYEDGFFQAGSAEQRAGFVRTRSGKPLERWRLDAAALEDARARLEGWDVAALESHLVRKLPNLVGVPLQGSDSVALAPVAPERFRRR
jgi:hypothetical protein